MVSAILSLTSCWSNAGYRLFARHWGACDVTVLILDTVQDWNALFELYVLRDMYSKLKTWMNKQTHTKYETLFNIDSCFLYCLYMYLMVTTFIFPSLTWLNIAGFMTILFAHNMIPHRDGWVGILMFWWMVPVKYLSVNAPARLGQILQLCAVNFFYVSDIMHVYDTGSAICHNLNNCFDRKCIIWN